MCTGCAGGYFSSSDNTSCLACPTNCFSCSDSLSCNSCSNGYFLQPPLLCSPCANNCQTCLNAQYCWQCNPGFYLEPSTYQCVNCSGVSPGCVVCNGPSNCTVSSAVGKTTTAPWFYIAVVGLALVLLLLLALLVYVVRQRCRKG